MVDAIKDLGVTMDGRMSFLSPFEVIISKSSRMLGFIKRISSEFHDPFTYKTLYISLVRPNLKHALAFGRLTSLFILSGWSECNTVESVVVARSNRS
jgi:hypothetical protein